MIETKQLSSSDYQAIHNEYLARVEEAQQKVKQDPDTNWEYLYLKHPVVLPREKHVLELCWKIAAGELIC